MIKSAGSATLLTALFILSAAHAADQDYCKEAFAIGNRMQLYGTGSAGQAS